MMASDRELLALPSIVPILHCRCAPRQSSWNRGPGTKLWRYGMAAIVPFTR
jgi:hypothetical protein